MKMVHIIIANLSPVLSASRDFVRPENAEKWIRKGLNFYDEKGKTFNLKSFTFLSWFGVEQSRHLVTEMGGWAL